MRPRLLGLINSIIKELNQMTVVSTAVKPLILWVMEHQRHPKFLFCVSFTASCTACISQSWCFTYCITIDTKSIFPFQTDRGRRSSSPIYKTIGSKSVTHWHSYVRLMPILLYRHTPGTGEINRLAQPGGDQRQLKPINYIWSVYKERMMHVTNAMQPTSSIQERWVRPCA